MFKTGDYVKFGKRGQVVYMVEVIGTEDTYMIRKVAKNGGRNHLMTAIAGERLVHAYPTSAKRDESIEVPTSEEVSEEQARHKAVADAVVESQARQVAVAKGIDKAMTKGRAPKGAQATRYGQAMREALARKNRRHVHA